VASIKVLIVDDHALCAGVAAFLRVRDIEVVGEAEMVLGRCSRFQALAQCRTDDLVMPGMDGITAIREIAQFAPRAGAGPDQL